MFLRRRGHCWTAATCAVPAVHVDASAAEISSTLHGLSPCAQMPAAERGHKQLGRAAAVRHLSQLLAVLGMCTIALLEACRGGVSQARATLVTAGLAYALQARLHAWSCQGVGLLLSKGKCHGTSR